MASADIPTVYGSEPLTYIPDHLTIPQFFLDSVHPLNGEARQRRNATWFIEDHTGREYHGDKVRARVWALANAMHIRWNFGDGDVVCIYGPNHVDYPIVMWAALRVGGIMTGANPSYTVDELVYQLQTAKATTLVLHPDSLEVGLAAARKAGIRDDRIVLFEPVAADNGAHASLDDLIHEGLSHPQRFVEPQLKPGEAKTRLALLFFSSGTTGRPKAVMIPHYAVIANCVQIKQFVEKEDKKRPFEKKLHRAGDIGLGVLPFYHIFGAVVSLHYYTWVGITLSVVTKFNFENMLKSIQKYKVGHLAIVPPMIVLLCKHPLVKNYDLSSIKAVTSGAAPLSAELTNQLVGVLPGAHIGQGYGMTETCTVLSHPTVSVRVGTPGSSGSLVPGTAVRIRKADGQGWAGIGETGELVVTGPSMALGYLDNEKATKETFIDGWVYTGDEGYVTADGEVYIVDRIKELIKVKGLQVAPAELEGHLLGHPDVADVCVIGAPDEYSGELPFAFVVLNANVAPKAKADPREAERFKESVKKHVADHKTQFKWLAGVELVDAVPKNPSGKLLRRVLRDQLKGLMASGAVKLVDPSAKKARAKL
ncbi:amp dependent CoA ligase [Epithele typhae]|uniref:amp dependent CoA ligase n=1 Tax=Epithele typhae TaxID=378194 RepID=UPI002007FA66|nr:amp dependent CoA ligase [Epithele typhae]KAH9927930.1 amp dependent CoA ligase [Epithele typhae]